MIDEAIEDINIIPFKRVLKKNDPNQMTGLSFYINNEIKKLPEKKNLSAQQMELPFEEWTTPSEPHGYIKCRDNDFL